MIFFYWVFCLLKEKLRFMKFPVSLIQNYSAFGLLFHHLNFFPYYYTVKRTDKSFLGEFLRKKAIRVE